MKPIFLKLTLAACAAMIATPTFAQPEAAAPAAAEANAAAILPVCKCPGEVVKRFRSPILARKWAASVRCGPGRCKGRLPCLKNVSIKRVGIIFVATVRCRCRLY
ncbi:MAG: hypothetical protein QOE79_226 [Sphingomonadales bacterium]|jgi:hypothetical protein|nr:hypothetical protein [Sphingomonadales bacterium]MEA3049994.1 hypothetical protein [Sphingomonadales bacterium]